MENKAKTMIDKIKAVDASTQEGIKELYELRLESYNMMASYLDTLDLEEDKLKVKKEMIYAKLDLDRLKLKMMGIETTPKDSI